MGYQTKKKLVMFRPRGDMEVMTEFPGLSVPRICPATVCDKLHCGYMIKYWLQVDDGAVRSAGHTISSPVPVLSPALGWVGLLLGVHNSKVSSLLKVSSSEAWRR